MSFFILFYVFYWEYWCLVYFRSNSSSKRSNCSTGISQENMKAIISAPSPLAFMRHTSHHLCSIISKEAVARLWLWAVILSGWKNQGEQIVYYFLSFFLSFLFFYLFLCNKQTIRMNLHDTPASLSWSNLSVFRSNSCQLSLFYHVSAQTRTWISLSISQWPFSPFFFSSHSLGFSFVFF